MIKRYIFLIMTGIFALSISGCRTSPVLEKVVYEQDHTKDEENQSDDNQPDHTEEDEQLASMKQVDQAESEQDREEKKAVSGPDSTNSDPAYTAQYREQTKVSNGIDQTTPTQQTDTNASGDTGNNGDSQSGAGYDNTQQGNNGNGGNNTDNNGDDDPGYTPSDDQNKKQIVDARGITVSVPENVTGVTATGEAGIMVGMLSGSERLMGTSQSVTANRLAQNAFGSGMAGVQTWWNGDGSGTISANDFQSLLSAKPDVCFEISGENTFNESQISQLQSAGIAYVVLPKLDTYDHIKEAVKLVGTVMGDQSASGGMNAPAVAEQYAEWVDKVTGMVGNASTEKTTIFISAWDSSAVWQISNSTSGVYQSGTGAAVASVSSGNVSLKESMNLAGVKNNGKDATYANPLQDGAWLQSISGTMARVNRNYNLLSDMSTGVCLGEDGFPAIVVADQSIKDQLLPDIHWQVYGKIQNGPYSMDYGFMAGNEFVRTMVRGSYDIYVNPTGVGNWTDGSVESPMEAVWLACKFQNSCSMDQLRDLVSEFYTTFYHVDVNTSDVLGE